MQLIKLNTSRKKYGRYGYKYNFSLFRCPVCGKLVEKFTQAGLNAKSCSKKCSRIIAEDMKEKLSGRKTNKCIDCAIDDCPWLLNGKPIKGWTASIVKYRVGNRQSKENETYTYCIADCPNFAEMKKG